MNDYLVNLGIALLIAVALFGIVAALIWSERGVLSRWRVARRLTARVCSANALKYIYKYELAGQRPSMDNIVGVLRMQRIQAMDLLMTMQTDRLIQLENGTIYLTSTGREAALHTLRTHRPWKRHLAEEAGFEEESWPKRAEEAEYWLVDDVARRNVARRRSHH